MPQVTVYEVAESAKVSIATVSRALNSPEKVNEATHACAGDDRPVGLCAEGRSRARARKGHGRIGVLAPFFTLPSFVERLRGVANALDDSPLRVSDLQRGLIHRGATVIWRACR